MKPIESSMCLKMKQTEAEAAMRFQIEPTRFQTGLDIDSDRLPRQFFTDRLRPGIDSLLLAMRFRDCLSEQEQNLLDLLAPDKCISFLIREQEFLHPTGIQLFPPDVLASMHLTGGNAILSLRYRPDVATDIDCYRLQAARINRPGQAPLILGILGPEPTLNNEDRESYFAHLASKFRQAWQNTADLAATIGQKLRTNFPVMVINRTSGRPLAVNQLLAALVELSQDQLINREYSNLAAELAEPLKRNKLTLKNISTDNFDLCVASIHPARPQPIRSSDECQLTGFLVHAMRNKLAAITAASGHMQSQHEDGQPEDAHELTDIILEEADKMNRHLGLLDLIANFDRYKCRPTTVSEELRRTTRLIRQRVSWDLDINIAADLSEASINAPAESLSLLFEAILNAHLPATQTEDRTTITLTKAGNVICLQVTSTLGDSVQKAVLDVNWQHAAERLATLMNFNFDQNKTAPPQTVETKLEIPTGVIQYVTK